MLRASCDLAIDASNANAACRPSPDPFAVIATPLGSSADSFCVHSHPSPPLSFFLSRSPAPSHYLLCVFFFFNELLEFYTRKSLTLTVRFTIIKTTSATANVLLISIFMFAFGPLPHIHVYTYMVYVYSNTRAHLYRSRQ